jgi:hypothetical protein
MIHCAVYTEQKYRASVLLLVQFTLTVESSTRSSYGRACLPCQQWRSLLRSPIQRVFVCAASTMLRGNACLLWALYALSKVDTYRTQLFKALGNPIAVVLRAAGHRIVDVNYSRALLYE